MKIILLVITLLPLLWANSLRSTTSNTLEALSAISGIKDTEFGKKLLTFVQVHLATEGKPEEIMDLLNQLKDTIIEDGIIAERTLDEFQIQWTAQLKDLNDAIANYKDEIKNFLITIDTLNDDQKTTESLIEVAQSALDKANENKVKLDAAYWPEKERLEKRIQQDEKAKEVIEYIIEALNAKANNEHEPVLLEMKKKAHLKKYIALVQVLLKFNPETMAKCIAKLEKIKEGFEAAINADTQYLNYLTPNFNKIMENLDSTIESLTEELASLWEHHAQNIKDLENNKNELELHESLLEQTEKQLTDLESYIAWYIKDYQEKKADREYSLDLLISQVIPLVQSRVLNGLRLE